MMLEGISGGSTAARQRIAAGKQSGQAIDTSAKALSEVLTAFAADLARLQRAAPPLGLVQVARYANPQNSSATALLAVLFEGQDRSDEALALLRAIPPNDALTAQVRDVQVRILSDEKRFDEAYQIAADCRRGAGGGADDYSRLGDLYAAMKRSSAAADAYGRALALATAQGQKTISGLSSCSARARSRTPTAGRKPSRRSSRDWRSRPTSRCCSISSAMRSSSGARTSMPPKR